MKIYQREYFTLNAFSTYFAAFDCTIGTSAGVAFMLPGHLIGINPAIELTGERGRVLPYHFFTFPPSTTRWTDTFVITYTINTGASKSTR